MNRENSAKADQKPLRVGIVGCGAITREAHLPELTARTDVAITILCDKQVANAELANLEFGLNARVVNDLAAFKGAVDCALVAVPPRLHAPISTQLMEMGIDVMCEKPTADTAAAANKMAELAREKNRILTVGLTSRYHANNALLLELVAGDLLGPIQEVVALMGAQLDWEMQSDAYYNPATTAGGVYYDAGIHMLDRALWLFGDMQVESYMDDSYGGVESNAVLQARLSTNKGPVPFRGEFSWTHDLGNCLRIIGADATAEVRMGSQDQVFISRKMGELDVVMTAAEERSSTASPLTRQWDDFLQAVISKEPPVAAVETTVRALELIEESYSMKTRIPQPWVDTGRSAI